MLAFADRDTLVTATLGDINDTPELRVINQASSTFSTQSRFYRILDVKTVPKDIHHLTREKREIEAIRIFQDISEEYQKLEYNEKGTNMGYKVFPDMKNPTVFTYAIVYPAITEFFHLWNSYSNGELKEFKNFDLSKLFYSMKFFDELASLFNKNGVDLRNSLYIRFPQFAIFYYEIYPYLRPSITGRYSKNNLINTKMDLIKDGIQVNDVDSIIKMYPSAENNTKVLKLIKDNANKFEIDQ